MVIPRVGSGLDPRRNIAPQSLLNRPIQRESRAAARGRVSH